MKIVYIAHPISGDVQGNIRKVLDIVRKVNVEEPDVVPFAPYIVDCLALDDNVPVERARGIKNNTGLLGECFVSEVRLYGDRISAGMQAEKELAEALGIPVLDYTNG